MGAAARVDPETGSRWRGHFRGASRAVARLGGMSNAKRCWRVSRLLFAPKVHFRNTDLEKECPLRPSVRPEPPDSLSPRPVHWMKHVASVSGPPVLLRT